MMRANNEMHIKKQKTKSSLSLKAGPVTVIFIIHSKLTIKYKNVTTIMTLREH